MGTNFYLESKPACETCGRPFEDRHIGKSSMGWCFSLHVYPEDGINDLPDWEKLFSTGRIYDEYGATLTPTEMLARITERSHPRGLARHPVDGTHTISKGAGTWDCCVGDFS